MTSKKDFLQLTRIKSNLDRRIYFLGPWCKPLNSIKEVNYVCNLGSKAIYDRNKIFKHLKNLGDRIIIDLSSKLNHIHKTNFSEKYWEQVIGHWVYDFLSVISNRWTCIKSLEEKKNSFCAEVVQFNDLDLVTTDYDQFISYASENDYWNLCLYSLILDTLGSISIEKVEVNNPNKSQTLQKKGLHLKNFLVYLSSFFGRKDSLFFSRTGMDRLPEMQFFKKFRFWDYIVPKTSNYNPDIRKSITLSIEARNDFEKFVIDIILKFLPKSYIEDFQYLSKLGDKIFPNSPNIIFTSVSHLHSDFFNIWSAKKRLKGAKLIIGEHGGAMRITNHSFSHLFQLQISDKFLSTGLSPERGIFQVTNFRLFKKRLLPNSLGDILFISTYYSRYEFELRSSSVNPYLLPLFYDETYKLYKNLRKRIRTRIRLRFPKVEIDNSGTKDRLRSQFSETIFDSESKFFKSLSRARFAIINYDGTPIFDLLALDYPIIVFINEDYFKYSDSFQETLAELKRVKIFHNERESFMSHIEDIYENVNDWWNNEETINARKKFCLKYSLKPVKGMPLLKNALELV